MPRKDNSKNPLEIALRVNSLPKGVSPKRYYSRLIQYVRYGTPLPRGWDISLGWRNRRSHGVTRNWRFDDFEDAVSDSREGFNGLLDSILTRKLRRY